MLEAAPAEELARAISKRLDAAANEPDFIDKAQTLFKVAESHAHAAKQAAEKILALRPDLGATKQEKALLKKLRKHA